MPKNNLKDFIYNKKLIPETLCDQSVKYISNEHYWEEHYWSTRNNEYSNRNDTELFYLYPKSNHGELFMPFVMGAIGDYMNEMGTKQMIKKVKELRFNRYELGQEMREHNDLISLGKKGEVSGVPILSIIGNLNTDYKGAELIINGEEMKLEKGSIVIFPSTFLYPHKVKPTTEGVRYSFVTWAY